MKRLLPLAVKRPVRRVIDSAQAALRMWDLQKCVRELRRRPNAAAVDGRLLLRTRRAWGNEAWSPDIAFITAIAERAASRGGDFLDCGSGLSTIVAAALTQRHGGRVWSLEQDKSWHEYMTRVVKRLGIDNVVLWCAPVRAYDDGFVWFDLEGRQLPAEFTAVFCDGPAIDPKRWPEPHRSNWRLGLVPVLRERGIGFREIVLDDAEDPRCERLNRHWRAAGIETRIVPTDTGQHMVAQPR
ncbi:MAG: hypothetical protein OER88_03620 [Planctomycetota bacterium]|nr:hypothetical protein [Planctomycetota bacterium]